MTLDKRRHSWRARTARLCASTVAALAFGVCVFSSAGYARTADPSIRPFKVQVPQAALDDHRRRIAATRWPDKETVADQSQGAQLAKLQELVGYWGSGYEIHGGLHERHTDEQ